MKKVKLRISKHKKIKRIFNGLGLATVVATVPVLSTVTACGSDSKKEKSSLDFSTHMKQPSQLTDNILSVEMDTKSIRNDISKDPEYKAIDGSTEMGKYEQKAFVALKAKDLGKKLIQNLSKKDFSRTESLVFTYDDDDTPPLARHSREVNLRTYLNNNGFPGLENESGPTQEYIGNINNIVAILNSMPPSDRVTFSTKIIPTIGTIIGHNNDGLIDQNGKYGKQIYDMITTEKGGLDISLNKVREMVDFLFGYIAIDELNNIQPGSKTENPQFLTDHNSRVGAGYQLPFSNFYRQGTGMIFNRMELKKEIDPETKKPYYAQIVNTQRNYVYYLLKTTTQVEKANDDNNDVVSAQQRYQNMQYAVESINFAKEIILNPLKTIKKQVKALEITLPKLSTAWNMYSQNKMDFYFQLPANFREKTLKITTTDFIKTVNTMLGKKQQITDDFNGKGGFNGLIKFISSKLKGKTSKSKTTYAKWKSKVDDMMEADLKAKGFEGEELNYVAKALNNPNYGLNKNSPKLYGLGYLIFKTADSFWGFK